MSVKGELEEKAERGVLRVLKRVRAVSALPGKMKEQPANTEDLPSVVSVKGTLPTLDSCYKMEPRKSRRVIFVAPDPDESIDPIPQQEVSVFNRRTPTPNFDRSRNSSIIPESELDLLYEKDSPELTHSRWVIVCNRVLVSYSYTFATTLVILYSMFGDDIRLLVTRPGADNSFYSLSVVAMVLLMADCSLRSWMNYEYRWSFAFVLDIAANLTLLADIGWIWDHQVDRSSQMLKTVGQASRVASRAATFIKVVRFIRMMRIIKMYGSVDQLMHTKTSQERQFKIAEERKRKVQSRLQKVHNSMKYAQKATPSLRLSTDVPMVRRDKKLQTMKRLFQTKRVKTVIISEHDTDIPPDSRISRVILHRSVQQIFGIVFFTSLFWAFSGIEVFLSQPRSYDYGLQLLDELANSTRFFDEQNVFISDHSQMDTADLIYLQIGSEIPWTSTVDVLDLRPVETMYAYTDTSVAVFDVRKQVRILALISIFRTVLFCGLLLTCAALVIHDFNVSVIYALERMLQMVRKIANDPLLVLRSKAPLVSEQQLKKCCCFTSNEDYGVFELQLLEDTFRKIGVMLALGFGTAGCDIISMSIKSASSLDPLIPGRKVFAVFCFISIHNFDKLALDLQHDVLTYSNHVATVVHSVAETYQGNINKNLGDAFLLVWKFNDDDIIIASSRESLNPFSTNVRLRTTLALISSVKILAKLARSRSLRRYATHTNVKCEVSVGLHLGWAFEGPIGSHMKIDATYISPHVNLASRVESSSKQYHVLLACSEEFAYRVDETVRPLLRHIDTVTLKGVETPMQLYCFDLCLKDMGVSKSQMTKQKVEANKAKLKEALEYHYFTAAELITQSSQIALLRAAYTEEFFAFYEEGLKHYFEGNWSEARKVFKESCLKIVPDDGPCQELLNFMAASQYTAPLSWPGYRVLVSK